MAACSCLDRERAMEADSFQYISAYDGWCFLDGPRRRMSSIALSLAATRGVDNHSGEPFVWHDCPFCGGELPNPDADQRDAEEYR